ncbi:uncharacterized protein J3D65DRAFT_664035 [Phyllosticta citribraziliensis]|uniref:Uncharacterized protein n=1 Tax=Phyllosticta citribraziliensis TaxID=989973 RepID=A0ABR1MAD3_9PEZI
MASRRAPGKADSAAVRPSPPKLDELLAHLSIKDDDEEERVPVRLPCGKVIYARRNRSARNRTGAFAPWVIRSHLSPQDAVTNRKFTLDHENTTPKGSTIASGSVRSQASTGGKDITLLKCVAARTANSVQSATETPYSGHSWKAKKMNFLRHMISLTKHVISKRVANLLAYEEKMRKDHEVFELVIDIRRNPHGRIVQWFSDEWLVLQEIAGVENSELEQELERRDDEAKLEHIKLAKEILFLEFDLEEFRLARVRLRTSNE